MEFKKIGLGLAIATTGIVGGNVIIDATPKTPNEICSIFQNQQIKKIEAKTARVKKELNCKNTAVSLSQRNKYCEEVIIKCRE